MLARYYRDIVGFFTDYILSEAAINFTRRLRVSSVALLITDRYEYKSANGCIIVYAYVCMRMRNFSLFLARPHLYPAVSSYAGSYYSIVIFLYVYIEKLRVYIRT